MKSKNESVYIIMAPLVISCIILFGAKSLNAQEVENEREFDYGEKSGKGPSKWGEMKKEWAACSNGTLQSPVDMSNERVKTISRPDTRIHKAANAPIKNRGHDIQIEWLGGAGSLFINGSEYPLRYDMEMHLVHLNTDPNVKNKIAVVGILFKIGKPDDFFSKLMVNISSISDKEGESSLGMVDPNDIEYRSKRFYRYLGSRTVPPCTEGNIWTLNKKAKTVSTGQIKLMREAVHDSAEENARPLQADHNREIDLYGPESPIDRLFFLFV